MRKDKIQKLKSYLYSISVRNIGNALIFNIPSRHLRLWTYKCFGGKIGKETCFFRTTGFNYPCNIELGNNTLIGSHCFLDGRGGIKVGNNVNISSGVQMITGGHDIDSSDFKDVFLPIEIGDYAWICTNALILQGVKIGKGAVVAAGSVVTKDVPDYAVVGGVPAKYIRQRSEDLEYSFHMPLPFY